MDGKLPPRRDDVFFAMRNQIADGIISFRNASFSLEPEIVCPITGRLVTKDVSHVDHVSPHTFRTLAETWMKRENLSFDGIALERRYDGYGWEMGSKDQARSWGLFHDTSAKLRIVHKLAQHV